MMEEVVFSVVLDDQVMELMSEEEILARLVSDCLPKHESHSATQLHHEASKLKDAQPEDPLHRYQTENKKLQEASLRLEQENDDLAHRLVTSKIALRSALDQAEEKVEELTKELLITKQNLLVMEEEKRGKEEEGAQLKELFRRELDSAEAEIKRTNSILSDYKKICSQLNEKLESQQWKAEEELAQIKSAVRECQRCRNICSQGGSEQLDGENTHSSAQGPEKDSLQQQVQQLEKELVQTKLHMVESRCRIQELEHQKRALMNELQAARSSWLGKTLGSLMNGSSSGGPQLSAHSAGSSWTGFRRRSWAPWEGKAAQV